MAADGRHSTQTANHRLESWVYANAAARTGATGFVSGDIGKIAYQTDTGIYYRLTATAPTWVAVNGDALTTNPLSQFAATTSAQLAGVLSDETGSGAAVFAGSPALTGTPTAPTAAGGTNTTQLATTAFVVAAVAAGGGISISAPVSGGTALSVLYIDSLNTLAQDNANFNYDQSTKKLTVGLVQTTDGTRAASLCVSGVAGLFSDGTNGVEVANGTYAVKINAGSVFLTGGSNTVLDTSTGTMFGTASNQLLGFWGATPISRPTANQAMTDSSGGSPTTTVNAVSGTGDDSTINTNFASILARLAEIRALFITTGLGA